MATNYKLNVKIDSLSAVKLRTNCPSYENQQWYRLKSLDLKTTGNKSELKQSLSSALKDGGEEDANMNTAICCWKSPCRSTWIRVQ